MICDIISLVTVTVASSCWSQICQCLMGRYLLCLSSGLHHSEEHLKANYITMPPEGCFNLKAPPDAPSSPWFWRMHHYEPSWPHTSQDSLRPKKKKEREKMATSRGVDVDNKVSSKDSPSKTAKAGSFRGRRPWTETQQQSEEKHVELQFTESSSRGGHRIIKQSAGC